MGGSPPIGTVALSSRNKHYFEDFINAMHKHTKDYDNDLEEEMQRRFLNTIYKAKKE